MDNVMTVKVDEDIINFLRTAYFGAYSDKIEAAYLRAYLDMNRTLRFYGLADEKRQELKQGVKDIFHQEIPKLGIIDSQVKFDDWHHATCVMVCTLYSQEDVEFYYGQAQKWLNMTLKYLYTFEKTEVIHVFEYLHVPLDNIVFELAKKQFGIPFPNKWSRMSKEEYVAYQKCLGEHIVGESPLRWEFRNWKVG